MVDPVTAVAAATKAWAGVQAFIAAGKSIEDTFTVVAKWQSHASDVLYASNKQTKVNPFKKIVFSGSVEAEAAATFAAKKKVESQRKELISLLNMAYGKEGVEEYRRIVKEVTDERQRLVYAQLEAKDALVKSFWIGVLTFVAGVLIWFIISQPISD